MTNDSESVDGDGVPRVPAGVLEGIENLANGNTASKEDLEDALSF